MIQTVILIAVLIGMVVFDACEDAFNRNSNKKSLGHLYGFIFVVACLLLPSVYKTPHMSFGDELGAFIALGGSYVGFRFSLFNPVWNKASNQKLNYIGSTSIFDKAEKAFMPWWTFWFTRVFAFVFGIILAYVAVKIYVL